MRSGLARGRDTVVATNAVIDNSGVVEGNGGSPRTDLMTRAALKRGRDMAGRQSRGVFIVVAGAARRIGRAVVHARGCEKTGHGGMAYITLRRGLNMRFGFTQRGRSVMTPGTLPRHTAKHAARVTGFARHVFVLTDEREPCGEMIEIERARKSDCLCDGRKNEQRKQRRDPCQLDASPQTPHRPYLTASL